MLIIVAKKTHIEGTINRGLIIADDDGPTASFVLTTTNYLMKVETKILGIRWNSCVQSFLLSKRKPTGICSTSLCRQLHYAVYSRPALPGQRTVKSKVVVELYLTRKPCRKFPLKVPESWRCTTSVTKLSLSRALVQEAPFGWGWWVRTNISTVRFDAHAREVYVPCDNSFFSPLRLVR